MATGAFLSESEIMRTALRDIFKHWFPYYKEKDAAKKLEADEHEELMNLPDEEYAKKVLPGAVIENRKAIIHHKNNPAWIANVPLDKVKQFKSRNDIWKATPHSLETE